MLEAVVCIKRVGEVLKVLFKLRIIFGTMFF